MDTGTAGKMKIQDYTDTPDNTVRLWLMSSVAISRPNLPWAWQHGVFVGAYSSFNFQPVTTWQDLGYVFTGDDTNFVFKLGDTGSVELGGPTDFSIFLAKAGLNTVSVKVGDIYKKALPFVNVGGVWKQAKAMVMLNSEWKDAT